MMMVMILIPNAHARFDEWAISNDETRSVSFACATVVDDDDDDNNNNDDDDNDDDDDDDDDDRNSEPNKSASTDRHNGTRERDGRTLGRARTKASIDKLKFPP